MPVSTHNTAHENINILYSYMIVYLKMIWDMISTQFHNSIYIYKKTGIFYEPLSPLPTVPYENNIKVLSYNIDDLACHRHQYTTKDQARATEIIKYLESTNADIICLQEVWGETMKQELLDAFIAKNYYVALPPWRKNYFFGENSGLMTISKYPIITQTFIPFNNARGTCRLFNKGVQYCHIRVPNSNPQTSIEFNIANTHLQASFGSYLNYYLTAKDQLNTIINDCPYESCLLVGDLNLTQNQLEDFIKNEQNIQYFGENTEVTFSGCDDRLDYVLTITKLLKTKDFINIENKTESHIKLSDHFPIISELKLNTDN